MEIFTDPIAMQRYSLEKKQGGEVVGFLATMGALHRGHLTLAEVLREECSVRVVSIFVNPTQFNDAKDFQAYPTPLEKDIAALRECGVDAVFTPSTADMYPSGAQSWVSVEELTIPLEGQSRPGHFRGVTTVVNKLFNIVQPDVTIFGEKDFQQLRVIEQMIADFMMPIRLIRGSLVRDPDGMAMSSRNIRLSAPGRELARSLSRGLLAAARSCQNGERRSEMLVAIVMKELHASPGIEVEYVAVVDESNLLPVAAVDRACRCLVAAKVDGVRLIDNVGLV